MSTYTYNCNSDYRNEGWSIVGASYINTAWNDASDSTYAKNPATKGRATVRFPADISSGSLPNGSTIQSVTVFIRANKTDSASRTVTVNVLSTDDTAHYTSRTIPLATGITTYEVGTYTKDPLNKAWTKDRLNRLMLQAFSYAGVADKVRVYELYAVVNFRTRPTLSVTSPSGTIDSAAPVVSWTYTQADGDSQKFAEYKVFTAAQQSLSTFNPDNTPALYPASSTYKVKAGDSLYKIAAQKLGNGNLWPSIYAASVLRSGNPDLIYPGEIVTIPGIASVQGDRTSFTLPFALAANDYYIYVRVTSTFGARSDWANRAFTITGSAPGVPGGSLGGVGTGGGGGFESVIADGQTSNAFLTVRDGSNLFGVHSADFETTTDSLSYVGTNCVPAWDTSTSYSVGGASMKMAATGAGNMTALSSFVEIDDVSPFTARAQFLPVATPRTCAVQVRFWDDSFVELPTSVLSASAVTSTTTWTEIVVTGTVPSGTAYATVGLVVQSAAAAEVHNVDHIGLMYGTNAAWSSGGHASRNLLTNVQSLADDPITVEPWTAANGSTYSRVATAGVGADGLKAFKMTYAGLSPSISFVSTATAFTDTTTGTGFTLNKPASVADGDLLVAYVASDTGGAATAPAGWVVVDSVVTATSSLTVLMRDALAADPSSWTGNLATSATRKRSTVVAYRGAASTGLQFPQENVSSSLSGSLVPTTAAVTNGDPGAWRLSCFCVRDDVTGGAMTANITAPSAPPNISYVGRGGVFKDTNFSVNYTVNKPSGTISGDLMIASIAVAGNVTVTAPAGWTKVREIHKTIGSGGQSTGSITTAILKRTAGGSEPSSWAGTHSGSAKPKVVQSVAYRGAADASVQFIAENGQALSTATYATPSVTNTDSRAWRVSIFTNLTMGGSSTTSNEVSERCDDTNNGNDYAANVAIYDSNGTVSTGSHTRTGVASNDTQLYSSSAWIGIIKPLASGAGAGPNETERQDTTAGASNPWLTLAAYDSNAVAPTGTSTVYGSFTPGSGTSVVSSCAWQGFLIPATPTIAGEVGATLVDYIDISAVSDDVFDRAGNQMTVQAAFLGSTAGVPHLKMYAYVGNELISTQIAECDSFNATTWTKGVARFVLPPGTTRLKMGVSAMDRAVSDYVLFNRVSIAFGGDTAYRQATGKAAHPIFNIPTIEYADDTGDGYGDWKQLTGLAGTLLKYDNLTGLVSFIDQTLIPLGQRKYRARTVSYGLLGDTFISGYGPESDEITLVADEWWLKDIAVPDNSMKLKVFANPLKVNTADSSAVFQPLGADLPMVVTEGYKGDTIGIKVIVTKSEYRQLRDLFNARRTLFLQSNMDNAWWVRPNGDIESETQLTGQKSTSPLRFVDVSFVEVDPEA